MIRPYLMGGAVVALIASHSAVWLHGRSTGAERAEARHAAAVARLERNLREVSDMVIDAEVARLVAERERNELLADLDREGDEADGASRVALPAGSVLRIDAIGR